MTQPQVIFYEILDKDPVMLVRAACKLTSEYYRQNARVHIITGDESTLESLDKTLWEYPRMCFVPHRRTSEPQDDCLVTMACSSQFCGNGSVLLNLRSEIPGCVSQFETVCEFVMQHEHKREQARERFVQYRNQYGRPEHFNLTDWDSHPILG